LVYSSDGMVALHDARVVLAPDASDVEPSETAITAQRLRAHAQTMRIDRTTILSRWWRNDFLV
jgi:hypothetical protein